ncbi:MAG: MBL fold metallo-hydrolase [Candidatus Levyibacteriota bacterium]|jgi:L-ascorbate metabolism protein UlaG (beta-lactamase superfamily)
MENLNDIKWFGHASFSFVDQNGQRIYYVDPFDLKPAELEKADLVFITHAHPDHFSPNDLLKILKDETVIIAPPDILGQIDRSDNLKQKVEPNQSYEIKGFKFQTIPAYNSHPEKLNFHPKANNWVGYIFELNGKKIYHAGDTDFIEEMKHLKELNLDVAMLPIGGRFTMDVEEAVNAANAIAAKITVPMHYRRLNSNYQDLEEKFKQLVTSSKVLIMNELS